MTLHLHSYPWDDRDGTYLDDDPAEPWGAGAEPPLAPEDDLLVFPDGGCISDSLKAATLIVLVAGFALVALAAMLAFVH